MKIVGKIFAFSIILLYLCNKKFMIYFIQEVNTGNVKIGYADNVEKRLTKMKSDNSSELIVIRSLAGNRSDERIIQNHFGDRFVRGEWFRYCDEMMTINLSDIEEDITTYALNSGNQSLLKRKQYHSILEKGIDNFINNEFDFLDIKDLISKMGLTSTAYRYVTTDMVKRIDSFNMEKWGATSKTRFNMACKLLIALKQHRSKYRASLALGVCTQTYTNYIPVFQTSIENYRKYIKINLLSELF